MDTESLDPEALGKLSQALQARETAANTLLADIRLRMQLPGIPPTQGEALRQAEVALEQILDGVHKTQATLVRPTAPGAVQ